MGYQVFRIKRGNVLHVIHETRTGKNRVNDVYTLCREEPASGERDRGSATCSECIDLDDPFNLHAGDLLYLRRVVKHRETVDPYEKTARRMLTRRDLITPELHLTRRGRILAEDWTLGAAPFTSNSGVAHARNPLQRISRCGVFDLKWDVRMSVERYAKLRALDLHVTCIECLNAPTW